MATEKLTVGQRVNKIIAEVGQVKATGKNAQGVVALSNEDVEDSLRPLFAKYGVVSKWTTVKGESWQEPTSKGGHMTLWRLDFHVRIEADDDPSDGFEADWFDIGGSPAAAESFAVKGYYKRLFHIASADDERQEPRQRPRERQQDEEPDGAADAPQPAPRPRANPLEGLPAGFTAEMWEDVKALASSTKLRVGAESATWAEFPYNVPGKLKVHIAKLAEERPTGGTDADRADYAWQVVTAELQQLGADSPPADRPGTLSYETVNLTKEFAADDEALRQAAIATG